MAQLACKCGSRIELPSIDAGEERILLCEACGVRTRVAREKNGKVSARRLARPEVEVRCVCGHAFHAVPPDSGGTVRCPRCGKGFTARKERKLSSGETALAAESARLATSRALGAIYGVQAAPGRDQDRASWKADLGIGAVADGVTTSPGASEAAEVACRHAARIFEKAGVEAGMRAISLELLDRREALLGTALDARRIASTGADPKAIARERFFSFQTTLAAFRIGADEAGARSLRLFACGDSAALAIGEAGLLASAGLAGTPEDAGHARFTRCTKDDMPVLPDRPGSEVAEVALPADAWVVAATDGLLSSFRGTRDLRAWLQSSREALKDAKTRAKLLSERRKALVALTGRDDDMAFVIVPPE